MNTAKFEVDGELFLATPNVGTTTYVINRIYVENFARRTTENDLYNVFSRYGNCIRVNIIRSNAKRCGFVTFRTSDEAELVLKLSSRGELRVRIHGKVLNIKPAYYKPKNHLELCENCSQCIEKSNNPTDYQTNLSCSSHGYDQVPAFSQQSPSYPSTPNMAYYPQPTECPQNSMVLYNNNYVQAPSNTFCVPMVVPVQPTYYAHSMNQCVQNNGYAASVNCAPNAHNVEHYENREICEQSCTESEDAQNDNVAMVMRNGTCYFF